jgi:hypothetical protein
MALEMQNHTHTHRLHQKRHRLASPCRLVLLHAYKWVGKSYKKLYCTEIITQACLLWCKITHTQITVIWYIRRLQCGHILMTRYAKSHTDRSCSQVILVRGSSILFAFVLFFMMRYAPYSGFFLMLTSEHTRKIQGGGNISLKIPS